MIDKKKEEEIGFVKLFRHREPWFFIVIVIIITIVSGLISLNLVESEAVRVQGRFPWVGFWIYFGYLSCVLFALLSKRMFISYKMRSRTFIIFLGLSFIIANFLAAIPIFNSLNFYQETDEATHSFLTDSISFHFLAWLLGGFLIIHLIYITNIFSKKPVKQQLYLTVDCTSKEKTMTIGEEADITFRIQTRANISLSDVQLESSGHFRVLEAFGELPIDLPAKTTYNKTFCIRAQKVGSTRVTIYVKFIAEEEVRVKTRQFKPIKISVRSPPPKLSVEAKLVSVTSEQIEVEKTAKLTLQITNIGKGEAKNVRVNLERLKTKGFSPFTQPKSVGSLPPGHNYIFDIQGVFLKSGTWKERISIHARDPHGTEISWALELPMIQILKQLPLLLVTVSNPKATQLDKIVQFQLQVENVQEGRAKNLVLEWKLPNEATVISGAEKIRIGDLTFNEKKTAEIGIKFIQEGKFGVECSLRGEDVEGVALPLVKSEKIPIEVTKQEITSPEVILHPISIQTTIDKERDRNEFSEGKVFSLRNLMKRFSCSESEVVGRIKELFQDETLFVTRSKDVIKIEAIDFTCQICMSSSTDNKYFKCRRCQRNICWDHFVELSMLGRSICPHCDGALEFLPKFCQKCSTDYLTTPKKQNYCDYCGFVLSYPSTTIKFATDIDHIIRSGEKSPKSQIETFSPKYDVKKG